MAPFPNKSSDDKIFFMPSSWVWKFPHSYPLIYFISGHLWRKDWAPAFLLCVINTLLAIKNFQPWSKFLYGQRGPVGETLMYSNLKGRVGKGRQFLLTFYPQRAGSVCCVFRVLCECGLYIDWNELKDNIGSTKKKKKSIFWHFSHLYHAPRYEAILRTLLFFLHRTMGLKLPLFISWSWKFIKHLKEINEVQVQYLPCRISHLQSHYLIMNSSFQDKGWQVMYRLKDLTS